MNADDTHKIVFILYTNHRSETSIRRILPISLSFGSTEWHPQAQWLLMAFDLDRDDRRTFAMDRVRAWWVEHATST